MKSGVAKRILFLVDRRALAAQAVRAFASFEAEPGLKFDKVYEVYSQRFQRDDLDEDEKFDPKVLPASYLLEPKPGHAFVYVCTIQRMTINLLGREAVFDSDEPIDEDAERLDIPIHAFDLVIADECHRGYTGKDGRACFAPNPYYGVCTLAHCKYGRATRRNIVELAKVGDWIVGTGGTSRKSAGNGQLIYAMRVDERLTLKQYYSDARFERKKPRNGSYQRQKGDNLAKTRNSTKRFVLISKHYFYFGAKAAQIPRQFRLHPVQPLEKKGPGFRSKFSESFVNKFLKWLHRRHRTGMLGKPHGYTFEQAQRDSCTVQEKKSNSVCNSVCAA
jgi:hypothetical protein